MEKAKRDLKSISVILIFIGVFSLVSSILAIYTPNGVYSFDSLSKLYGYTIEQTNGLIASAMAISIVSFLLELFVGLKGIIVANGGKKSKLATLIIVLNIILLVIGGVTSIAMIVRGQATLFDTQLIIQFCELIMFILYIVKTNKVVSLRRTTV